MKNIWIINEYANTTNDYGGIRHSMLAENLSNYKYNVLIFIGSLIHNTNKNRLGRLEKMRIEYIKDVGYVLIKLNPINASYKINRIFLMLQFFFKLLLIDSRNFNQKPDLILGSSPSPLSALAGYLLSLKFKAKFIYEVRDLWPATLISFKILKKNNFITFLLFKLEKFLAFRAEKIIVLFKNGANYFKEIGVNLEKITYISNGTNLIKKNINLKKNTKNTLFNLMYFGAHGMANNLDNVLYALKIAQNNHVLISLTLYGDGNEKESLKALSKKLKLKNVFFKDNLPREEIFIKAKKADAFIYSLRDLPELYKYGLSPNKFFDYMILGKPIIYTIPKGLRMFEDFEPGISCRPNDPISLFEAITTMINLSHEARFNMASKSYDYVSKNFLYSNLGNILIDVIKELS